MRRGVWRYTIQEALFLTFALSSSLTFSSLWKISQLILLHLHHHPHHHPIIPVPQIRSAYASTLHNTIHANNQVGIHK